MSLSSLIVQREVATMRQVEEALARQVIYGGDLATNLMEVARVDEGILTLLIAQSMDLPPAPAGELPIAQSSVSLVQSKIGSAATVPSKSIKERNFDLSGSINYLSMELSCPSGIASAPWQSTKLNFQTKRQLFLSMNLISKTWKLRAKAAKICSGNCELLRTA